MAPVFALPPATDPPEEIQRTEIITEARSPLNGAPLTAAEYAELEAQIQENPNAAPIKQEYRRLITLLRIRRAIRSVFPFLVR
ncbi:glutathione S-transferase [Phormidium tenue FACHB-886]|nr:glutathione S-transferase [Phormidium tenue FACHB-886]